MEVVEVVEVVELGHGRKLLVAQAIQDILSGHGLSSSKEYLLLVHPIVVVVHLVHSIGHGILVVFRAMHVLQIEQEYS